MFKRSAISIEFREISHCLWADAFGKVRSHIVYGMMHLVKWDLTLWDDAFGKVRSDIVYELMHLVKWDLTLWDDEFGKVRSDIVYEMMHLVHCLLITGTCVTLCWIPSHCGLTLNEWADRAAIRGAINNRSMQSTILDDRCNLDNLKVIKLL